MIRVVDLHKTYGHGDSATRALKGVDLRVRPGEFVAIMGRSGSGKSTLLHILGLLDLPTEGEFLVRGQDMLNMNETERARFRLEEFGYVFQEYSLLPGMTILENVCVPAIGLGKDSNVKKRARELLKVVGLDHRLKHLPSQVSGGEQQRAAIARALVNQPRILFADEPTASLDLASSRTILDLFRRLNKEMGQTIVMVTHEPDDLEYVDRVIWLKEGRVDEENKDGLPASS